MPKKVVVVVVGILHKANDLKLSFDSVNNNLIVPPYIAISTLTLSCIMYSKWSHFRRREL